MFYYILLIIFLLFSSIFTYKKFKDFFSPSFLMSFAYLISSIFALLTRIFSFWNDINLTFKTFLIIFLGIGATIIGELFARKMVKIKEKKLIKKEEKHIRFSIIINILMTIFIIFSFIAIYHKMASVTGIYDDISKMINVYHNGSILYNKDGVIYTIGTFLTQFYRLCIVLGYILIYVVSYNYCKKDKIKNNILYLLLITIISFLSLIYAGRTQIITYIMSFIFDIFMIKGIHKFKNISKKNYIQLSIIFLAIMFAFFMSLPLLGRNSKFNAVEYISFYVGNPIPSLEKAIDTNLFKESKYFGENTFKGPQRILYKFGLIETYDGYQHNWLHFDNGYHNNVFTGLSSYYIDFGYIGIFILSFISGICVSLFYLLVNKYKNYFTIPLYSIYFFGIINQFRAEFLFSNLITLDTFLNILYLATVVFVLFCPRLYFISRRKV